MREVGRTIANQRKAKNLTQSELAESLGVSHQAVSSWENGQTSPDIGKLGELSTILKISIDDLLGNKHMAEIIEKVKADEVLSDDELLEIAPITKPSLFGKLLDEMMVADMNLDALVGLAPFANQEQLSKMVAYAKSESLSDIIPLAPFLESNTLWSMIEDHIATREFDMHDFIGLVPFLNNDQTKILFTKTQGTGVASDIIALAPFLEEGLIDSYVIEMVTKSPRDAHLYLGVAPFLSQEAIAELTRIVLKNGSPKDIIPFAPFLD